MAGTETNPAALVPGAMAHTLSRRLPDGSLIQYEEAPAGWLTKDGTVRHRDWRAYHYTPAGAVKRTRLTSVTTLLDDILPKPGLPVWSEAHGIRGAIAAVRQGLVAGDVAPDEAVAIVRRAHLGADAAKDQAADRGLNVHALLEEYMRTGAAPRLAGHPEPHHGYIRALASWLLAYDPQPVAVEQIVADTTAGYAGRLDLRAHIGDRLITVDLKTQENAAIYEGAHFQVGLYERAAIKSGDEPADGCLVVVVAADGQYRVMAADHEPWRLDAALLFRRAKQPITAICEKANKIERDARREVVAA
jgi:hypothetical protein